MNDHDQYNLDPEDDEQIQITDLDPEGASRRKYAQKLVAFVQKSVTTPWIRNSLFGALILILVGAIFLQTRPPASTTPGVTSKPTPPGLSLPYAINPLLIRRGVANNRIFLQASDNTVTAYQAQNGQVLWHSKLPMQANLQASASALYCYFVTAPGHATLEALDAKNGNILWRDVLPVSTEVQQGRIGQTNFLLAGDTIYVGGQRGLIYAIQAGDGNQRWTYDVGEQILSLSAILEAQNGIVAILAPDSGVLHMLNASDGREIVRVQVRSDYTLPLIDGQMVYVLPGSDAASIGQSIQVFHLPDGKRLWTLSFPHGVGTIGEQDGVVYLSNVDDSTITALRGSDGHQLWTYKTSDGQAMANDFVAQGGFVYLLQQDTTLVSIRVSDGQVLWHTRITAFRKQVSDVAPILDNGLLILFHVLTSQADADSAPVYAFRASDGHEVWHASRPIGEFILQNGILSIMQYNGSLNAFDESSGQFLWRYDAPIQTNILANFPGTSNVMLLLSQTSELWALSTSDGRLLWSFPPAS